MTELELTEIEERANGYKTDFAVFMVNRLEVFALCAELRKAWEQIERLRNCRNCKHYDVDHCSADWVGCLPSYKKWECGV